MRISFENQVAVVTGAGRGLGREYALEIARRGGAVVVADIGVDEGSTVSRAQAVVDEIAGLGGRAVAATDSVSTADGGRAIVDLAAATFGRVDIVVHNAGFLRPGFFGELSDAAVRDVFDVHVMGAFNVGQPAWKLMKQQGYGRFVLTSSGAVFGYHASANYAAAKAAIIGLTTALANEGARDGIFANAILPLAQSNIVKDNPVPGSSMQNLKDKLEKNADRWRPDSVSPLVAYLASSACRVSGHGFSAVAGRYARVGLALSEGWLSPPGIASAEDIREHFAQIDSMSTTCHPGSMIEEMTEALNRL